MSDEENRAIEAREQLSDRTEAVIADDKSRHVHVLGLMIGVPSYRKRYVLPGARAMARVVLERDAREYASAGGRPMRITKRMVEALAVTIADRLELPTRGAQ
jgi:hypothetical protein